MVVVVNKSLSLKKNGRKRLRPPQNFIGLMMKSHIDVGEGGSLIFNACTYCAWFYSYHIIHYIHYDLIHLKYHDLIFIESKRYCKNILSSKNTWVLIHPQNSRYYSGLHSNSYHSIYSKVHRGTHGYSVVTPSRVQSII